MKYYKITKNGKCKDQLYKVGETYTLPYDPVPCKYGFHFCQNPDDLFFWYDYNKETTIIFEVEPLGKTIHKTDKSVTNKIKIIKQVKPNEYDELFKNFKFDESNNLIYYKDLYGIEVWCKYNENNNMIHKKYSNGYEYWYEYDENNNLTYYKSSNDREEWYKYDENNNLIYWKNSDGYEKWYEYDENNNLIHFKNYNGFKEWYE